MSDATPRKICPLLTAGSVERKTIMMPGEALGVTVSPVQCLGPECQFWAHDERMPAETGNCGIALTAVFSAMAAVQVSDVVNNTAAMGQLLQLLAQQAGVKLPTPPTTEKPSA